MAIKPSKNLPVVEVPQMEDQLGEDTKFPRRWRLLSRKLRENVAITRAGQSAVFVMQVSSFLKTKRPHFGIPAC